MVVTVFPVSGARGRLMVPAEVPVDPEAPEATEWITAELSKAPYQAAKPSWFDLLAKAVWDWIDSLQLGNGEGPAGLGLGLVIAIVVGVIVVAFLVFGLPRLNRKSAVSDTNSLFGEDDRRSAAKIRQDAEAAAARGDHSTAVVEMFRALARGLAERTIVTTSPGTTARDFAARCAIPFPALEARMREAAALFDRVRYLGREGTAEQFTRMVALERELRATTPILEEVPV
ncbi:MAG: DUF4129 domain-containing protein [Rhodoglobus sp.]